MSTRFIFENGSGLTPKKQQKLIDGYANNGIMKLPVGVIIRSIQVFPEGVDDTGHPTTATLIIIGQ
jgi:hypothetical protein